MLRLLLAIVIGLHPWAVARSQDAVERVRDVALARDVSLQSIQTLPGFSVNLIAAEPLVIDPIDVAFDDAGRMWVVEMRDYPYSTSETLNGCVKVLTDTNGDAVYDQAIIFADKLDMPTGLALWQDGVLVTLAGELAFFRDTDADSIADEKQRWLVGFSQDNEQLRANHPTLGPDGWWYIASGLRGGNVGLGSHFVPNPSEPIKIGSRDVRFSPAQRSLELVTGPAQFGLCFDLLGSRFFCSNRNPAVQVIFEQPTLTGNPLAGLLPSTLDVLPAGAESQVFPIVDAWTTSNLHAGQFTAACGVFLKHQLDGSEEVFVCEPTGSLVKRQKLGRSPASLVPLEEPSAAEAQREWLASRDPWFRPVNVTLAPNNDIVIVDMHRAVIEHPNWVPAELKQRPDERWGNDTGRVLRIGEANTTDFATAIRELASKPLRARSSKELVALLSQSNQWTRDTVSRILLERQDKSVVPQLLEQAADVTRHAATRIVSLRAAVNLLQQLPAKFEDFLDFERSSESQGAPDLVLVAALRLVQAYPTDDTRVHASVLRLANSTRHAGRGQSPAYTETQLETLIAMSALGLVPTEVEFVRNILSAPSTYPLVAAGSVFRAHPDRLISLLGSALNSAGREDALLSSKVLRDAARPLTLAAIEQPALQPMVIQTALAQFRAASNDACRVFCLSVLESCLGRSRDSTAALLDSSFWSEVRDLIRNASTALDVKRGAILVLGYSRASEDTDLLRSMVMTVDELALAEELLDSWAITGDPQCDVYLLSLVSAGTPRQQQTALRLIRQSAARVTQLAAALESGELGVKQIGAAELTKLAERAQGETKQGLAKLLEGLINSDRSKVVAQYTPALASRSDTAMGKAVFGQYCAACHRVGDLGVNVGPDISDSRTKQPIELLTAILDPNRAIDNNYFRYVLLTNDDQVLEGIIAEETSDAIVLKSQNDVRHVVQRSDLQKLKATGVSLMPEGLETQIDPTTMANLIAYIKEWRYLDGAIPMKQLAPQKK